MSMESQPTEVSVDTLFATTRFVKDVRFGEDNEVRHITELDPQAEAEARGGHALWANVYRGGFKPVETEEVIGEHAYPLETVNVPRVADFLGSIGLKMRPYVILSKEDSKSRINDRYLGVYTHEHDLALVRRHSNDGFPLSAIILEKTLAHEMLHSNGAKIAVPTPGDVNMVTQGFRRITPERSFGRMMEESLAVLVAGAYRGSVPPGGPSRSVEYPHIAGKYLFFPYCDGYSPAAPGAMALELLCHTNPALAGALLKAHGTGDNRELRGLLDDFSCGLGLYLTHPDRGGVARNSEKFANDVRLVTNTKLPEALEISATNPFITAIAAERQKREEQQRLEELAAHEQIQPKTREHISVSPPPGPTNAGAEALWGIVNTLKHTI